ncbi:MAG: hypothetical protein R3B99_32855 [Polyangiales bacterium]
MLDIPRLDRIRLEARPRWQRAVARGVLFPNYELVPARKVEIVFEGYEKVPKESVVFAMNHTDRFNYWPFQYQLWRDHRRFTATWVKGKYYENPIVGKFMEMTNNLPTVSRGSSPRICSATSGVGRRTSTRRCASTWTPPRWATPRTKPSSPSRARF